MNSLFTRVARAVGFESEQTETPEFTKRVVEFKTHVNDLQKVRDALQLYSDSMEAMLAAQVVLGDALDAYYRSSMKTASTSEESTNDNSREDNKKSMIHHNVARLYKGFGNNMQYTMRPVLHEVFVSRCVRPVNFILARVPFVDDLLKARKKLVAEFNDTRMQYSEKQSGVKAQQLEEKLVSLQTQIATNNHSLMLSLDEFAVARPLMLKQEFASLVACSFHHFRTSANHLATLLPVLPQAASSLCLLQASSTVTDFPPIPRNEERVDIILERAKVVGGRTGGYGGLVAGATQSPACHTRRKSIKSQRLVAGMQTKVLSAEQEESDDSDAEHLLPSKSQTQSHTQASGKPPQRPPKLPPKKELE